MTSNIIDKMKDHNITLSSNHVIHESVRFGILLAVVGGFLDAYTFLSRGGVFANAQTGNVVLLGVYAAKGEWGQALSHMPPILAFICGVIVAEAIKNNSSRLFMKHWVRSILIFESIVLFAIGFIPKSVPDTIVTVIVSFAASLQVSSFRKLVDSAYNTAMTTGNLRTASQAAYVAFTKKDREATIRAIRFFIIIFTFTLGAFLGGLMTMRFDNKAVWGAVVVLLCADLVFKFGEGTTKSPKA